MIMDKIINDLIPTLRFTLMNPTEDSKAELLAEIEELSVGEPLADDLYYFHLLRGLTARFLSEPSEALLRHFNKVAGHYLVLVEIGAVEVQRVGRVNQFNSPSSNIEWLKQEIEDRSSAFINKPTEETKGNLMKQLSAYLDVEIR
jgi:hypothetical protein